MPIYFIRDSLGNVKIGKAVQVQRRLAELQCASAFDLELVREIDGDHDVEQWLHRRFAELNVRGEWFKFVEDMMVIQPPSGPELRETLDVISPAESLDPKTPPAQKMVERLIRRLGAEQAARRLGVHFTTMYRWRRGADLRMGHGRRLEALYAEVCGRRRKR